MGCTPIKLRGHVDTGLATITYSKRKVRKDCEQRCEEEPDTTTLLQHFGDAAICTQVNAVSSGWCYTPLLLFALYGSGTTFVRIQRAKRARRDKIAS